jgi:cytochrome c biogenesis protein CcmG/thiol:disulfide interchange protein DsbE
LARATGTEVRIDETTLTGLHRSVVSQARTLLASAAIAFAAGASAVSVGEAAPAFVLPTAAGESIALDKLKGRVVYVDFWASWCGPCRRSFPWLNEMQQKYGAHGFTVVGVNVDKRRPDAQRFLQQTPAVFSIVYDETGKTPEAWAVKGMPSSYLVDATGKVVAVESGFRDEQKSVLEDRIRALLPTR